MNKLFFRIGFIICGLFAMLSCGVSEMKIRLKDVESYIMERPDSALSVLDSMDRTLLTTDRLKAHHALLHAMALDKNYIDVTDDSLASVALDYYSRKGPKKYEARSRYYLGLSYFYAGDLSKAILEFTRAEEVSEMSDSLYLAMIKTIQGHVYIQTHNDVEALNCYKKSYDLFSQLSMDFYMRVAEYGLAKAYFNVGDVVASDSILRKLSSPADADSNSLISDVLADRAYMCVTQPSPDYHQGVYIYEKILREYDNVTWLYKDYWAYAYALLCEDRSDSSNTIIDTLSQIDTSLTAKYWLYQIEKKRGNVEKALSLLEKSVTMNNTEVINVLKQSLFLSQREYYESQYRETSLMVRVKNQMMILMVCLSVFILLLILYIIHRYASRQRAEKEKMMEYVEEIKRQLVQAKDEDYPLLKKRFIDLYKSRFETIGTLCEQYLQNKDRTDVEKVMYQKMLLMIEEIRNDNVRKVKFESLLNFELDGIMQNFRNEMPKSKEWEVTMFSYLVAGFDATMISRLMDMPLNNVYAYKRRLKLKIEDKKPEHSAQFLEMIS
ncbi:MAG: hypothetical protein IJ271_06755 [Bacteroidales bacterium]|nr:hypothetical protein [Bacteroidales bacterium]